MRNAVRKRHGLASARAGDDEQRPGPEGRTLFAFAVFGCQALSWIQQPEIVDVLLRGLHESPPIGKEVYFYTVLDGFTSIR